VYGDILWYTIHEERGCSSQMNESINHLPPSTKKAPIYISVHTKTLTRNETKVDDDNDKRKRTMLRSRRLFALRQHLEPQKARSVLASAPHDDHDGRFLVRQQQQQQQQAPGGQTVSFSSLTKNSSRSTTWPLIPSRVRSSPLSTYAHTSPSTTATATNTNTNTNGIFVSRHNNSMNLTATSILEYCGHHSISQDAKTSASHVILRECPFCSKPTNDKVSNLYKLHIKLGDGAYFCHRCGNGGSWYDFKAALGGYAPQTTTTTTTTHAASPSPAATNNTAKVDSLPVPPVRLSGYYNSRLLDAQHAGNDALSYLMDVRGMTNKTLRHYGVGRATYDFPATNGYERAECVTFPWIEKHDDDFITRRIKVRALKQKGWQRLDPAGGGWGLFGLHTIPDDATSVILTEGEYDAMAVYQATGLPAVSLPNGCRSLPLQVLPMLEKFEKIILWMDQDGPGQEGAEKFAKKLGMQRCHIVQTPHGLKDANDVLLKNIEHALEHDGKDLVDMRDLIDKASVLGHDRILTFKDLRADVLQEFLEPEKFTGTPVTSLPGFTKLIKGYRNGELTVLTGPTGSGKVRGYILFPVSNRHAHLSPAHLTLYTIYHDRPPFWARCPLTWPNRDKTSCGAPLKSKIPAYCKSYCGSFPEMSFPTTTHTTPRKPLRPSRIAFKICPSIS
jgi:hypothetical protein